MLLCTYTVLLAFFRRGVPIAAVRSVNQQATPGKIDFSF